MIVKFDWQLLVTELSYFWQKKYLQWLTLMLIFRKISAQTHKKQWHNVKEKKTINKTDK